MKPYLITAAAVFVLWTVLDLIIHQFLLGGLYDITASVWRPRPEMKMGLMTLVTLVSATTFSVLYGWLVQPKTPSTGLRFGFLYGLASGVPMGLGMYCVLPIPLSLAIGWLLAALVEGTVGGIVAASVFADKDLLG